MSFNPNISSNNQLLDAALFSDLTALAPHLDWVEFALGDIISEPQQPLEFAYFPVSGVVSVVTLAEIEDQVEMGIIGKEGFIGASILLLAGHDPFRIVVEAPGRALRLPASKLIEASDSMPMFRAVLLRFLHTFMVQTASTILTNSSYVLDERLARWLLMCHDRLDATEFALNWRFLSLMLAARRTKIVEALDRLIARNLLRLEGDKVQLLNRSELQAFANNSYGQAEREHRRLIGPAPRPQAAE
jgi:CRP-like cAMP-binding protein